MSTTSLKLPEALKQRAISAAHKQGLSPHAFMIQAIEQAATAAEQRASFVADALSARDALHATGEGYAAEEVHSYLKARIAGAPIPRPQAKTWRG